jgi:NAD(P)-dependent dehydrogenase (short-subunit alcohol dehydrogenase family)
MAVLVTGGALRLGRHICLAFAAKGVPVAIHCRNSIKAAQELRALIEQGGCCAAVVQGDLADVDVTRTLVADAAAQLGCPIDTVVNSASIFEHDQLEDLQEAVFLEHMRVNLFAPMELSSGLLKHVQARRAGGETIDHGAVCIVNLLDQKLANTNPDHLSYTMSKYGYVFSHIYTICRVRSLSLYWK